MKKILLLVLAFIFIFGVEKVYACIQDCSRNANIGELRHQNQAYRNIDYHHKNDADCEYSNYHDSIDIYEYAEHQYDSARHHHNHHNHH